MKVIFIKKYKNYKKGTIDEIQEGEELDFLISTNTVEECKETIDLSSDKLKKENEKLKAEIKDLKNELKKK